MTILDSVPQIPADAEGLLILESPAGTGPREFDASYRMLNHVVKHRCPNVSVLIVPFGWKLSFLNDAELKRIVMPMAIVEGAADDRH